VVLERDFLLFERLQLETDLAALHEHRLHRRVQRAGRACAGT
jgi:hypothetical protein